MTGGEQLVVWLFGILMAAVTVTAVAKAWAGTRTAAVQAQLEAAKTYLNTQAQQGPLFMPRDWTKDGGL